MTGRLQQHKPATLRSRNRVRIIGGNWRSRIIDFPDSPGLRPTPDRVRETLFNWLGQSLAGKRCLDLFAGSGVLGFEAASRGAASVIMVESAKEVVAALRRNQLLLAAGQCQILAKDAVKAIDTLAGKFDVVFIDPPFSTELMPAILAKLGDRLDQYGCVYAEWRQPLGEVIAKIPQDGWKVMRHGQAGAVHFALLSKEQNQSISGEVAP